MLFFFEKDFVVLNCNILMIERSGYEFKVIWQIDNQYLYFQYMSDGRFMVKIILFKQFDDS